MTDLLSHFNNRTEYMLEVLQEMVRYESPTRNKPLVDRLGDYVHGVLDGMDAHLEVFKREEVGNIRLAKWNRKAPGKPIMILVHLDTVWPEGTIEREVPLKITEDALHGPGALDMKGGITGAMSAIRGLQDVQQFPDRPIWMLLTTDEEIGSPHSRDLIRELAPQVGLVLVTEPAGSMEAVKTGRKGIARYWVRSEGLAAHSGHAPEAGINAVIDNAHQAIRIHDLNDLPNGTSVTVTQFNGGVALNVVPAESELYADVRFTVASEADRIDLAMKALEPIVPGAQVNVRGFVDRLPMERNEQMVGTFKQAREIAKGIGLELHEEFSGGGSDGNFTASMGIPTLDGLGPDGTGMHALHEHILIRSLPRRAALIAAILRDWKMADK